MYLLAAKLLVVVAFLWLFIRRPNLARALALLATTSALLLDATLGALGREQTMADLGYFFYVIAGAIFGAAAVAVWTWLAPLRGRFGRTRDTAPEPTAASMEGAPSSPGVATPIPAELAPVLETMRAEMGREDVLDLIFDLGLKESDLMPSKQNLDDLIESVVGSAGPRDPAGFELAVERIVAPIPAEHLPRLEKLSAESPPTIVRHYLLANFDVADITRAGAELGMEWEPQASGSKRARARQLLLHAYHHQRIGEVVDWIKNNGAQAQPADSGRDDG